tara:strand:+ start:486 stop:623 length:138 start_codon:yes stop_codon:yes gene_type:complete
MEGLEAKRDKLVKDLKEKEDKEKILALEAEIANLEGKIAIGPPPQ